MVAIRGWNPGDGVPMVEVVNPQGELIAQDALRALEVAIGILGLGPDQSLSDQYLGYGWID